jgi:GR25 family glycosyltransferase involved in LPS biosynthesis
MTTSQLNTFFKKIYVLYITESERYRIAQKLEKNGIVATLFEGVNGSKIGHRTKLSNGSYGHSASFIKILEDATEANHENILILEPDIWFCEDFESHLTTYAEKIQDPKNDIIYLGASQYMFYKEKTWDKVKVTDGSYKPYKTLGTFAVGFRSSMYEKYINILKKFEAPSDVCLTELQKNSDINGIVLHPNLICCDLTQSSTIQSERPKQINAFVNYRWLLKYDFEDHFPLHTKTGRWYALNFNINSNMDKFEIVVGDLPPIRDLKLIRLLNKNHTDLIYFRATGELTDLKMNGIFGAFQVKEIQEPVVKSSLVKSYFDRMKSHPLAYYYNKNLYRALSAEKI